MRIACRPLGVSSVVVSLPRSCNRGQRYETELKRKKIRRKRGVRRDEKRIEKQQAEERGEEEKEAMFGDCRLFCIFLEKFTFSLYRRKMLLR